MNDKEMKNESEKDILTSVYILMSQVGELEGKNDQEIKNESEKDILTSVYLWMSQEQEQTSEKDILNSVYILMSQEQEQNREQEQKQEPPVHLNWWDDLILVKLCPSCF